MAMTKKSNEVLFTTDTSGEHWNVCMWDFHSGTSLSYYKGGSTTSRGLALIAGEYLLAANNARSVLHVWTLQRREQMQSKVVFPKKISSLAVSPDGCFCVAGIEEKIYVWQVSSGDLLAIVQKHYQNITCVKFVDNITFVSGGEDNLVVVWSLTDVVRIWKDACLKPEPLFTWKDHSLAITDIHVGAGGLRSRIVTASLDQTCKMWDLCSGQLLCDFIFPVGITSVVMDAADSCLFAGAKNGHIYTVDLFENTNSRQRHVASDTAMIKRVTAFNGHDQQVTCLAMSKEGDKLISGSDDCNVKIWDISSGQCIRTLPHKGAVTNVLISPVTPAMLNPNYKPTRLLGQLKRNLQSVDEEGETVGTVLLKNQPQSCTFEPYTEENGDVIVAYNRAVKNTGTSLDVPYEEGHSDMNEYEKTELIKKLKDELKQVKKVNDKLFEFTILKLSET